MQFLGTSAHACRFAHPSFSPRARNVCTHETVAGVGGDRRGMEEGEWRRDGGGMGEGWGSGGYEGGRRSAFGTRHREQRSSRCA